MEEEVKAYFDDMPKNREEAAKAADWASPMEKGHGRIEKRAVTVAPCGWFEDKGQWAGLRSFIRVKKTVTIGEKQRFLKGFTSAAWTRRRKSSMH